jgi:type I restriction enzyme, S subunit
LNTKRKDTELGLIPEDWATATVGDVAARSKNAIVGGPFGSDLVSKDYVETGVPVIRGQNLTRKYVAGDFVFVSPSKAKSLRANLAIQDDLIFTQRGTVGQVSLVPALPYSRYLVSQSQMKVTVDRRRVDPRFLYFVFCGETHQKIIRKETIQTGVPHINLGILRAIPIQLPPLREQVAIADAISDAAALVESLEQLLAKKRLIKQGAMQDLLTGKKRLPDYNSEWHIISIGELFDISGGLSASRDQLSDQGLCYLHYGDIHGSNRTFIDVDSEQHMLPKLDIPLKSVRPKSLLRDGDIVFVDASEDVEGASRHVVIDNPRGIPFVSGLHTIVAKSRNGMLDHRYRRYCFQTAAVREQFRFFAVGTKVTGISKTNIAKIDLHVPPLSEQLAIAGILSDMDAEIEAIEAKLAKAGTIKTGMMQELLTGKTRLVNSSAVAGLVLASTT